MKVYSVLGNHIPDEVLRELWIVETHIGGYNIIPKELSSKISYWPLGVFSSREKAIKRIEDEEKLNYDSESVYSITEFELDTDNELIEEDELEKRITYFVNGKEIIIEDDSLKTLKIYGTKFTKALVELVRLRTNIILKPVIKPKTED